MTTHVVRRFGLINAYLVEEDDGLTLIDALVRGSMTNVIVRAGGA